MLYPGLEPVIALASQSGKPRMISQDLLLIIRINRGERLGSPLHRAQATSMFGRSLTCGSEFRSRNAVIPFVAQCSVVRVFPEGVALVRSSSVERSQVAHEPMGCSAGDQWTHQRKASAYDAHSRLDHWPIYERR